MIRFPDVLGQGWTATRLAAVTAGGVTAIGCALRVHVIAQPTEVLTARYLADDYFYYLNVAHNLAHGHGSSFDGGLTFTSGYQPLFLWMLAGVFALGASKASAIHAGLLIQAMAAAGASLLAYRLLASRNAPWAGALAAGLISLNLFFVMPTLTGFEMGLALACVLLALWSWERHHPPAVVGALCGVAVLARVDSLLLPAAFGALLIHRRRARDLILLVAGVAAVAGPWALWNWTTFGQPLPDSGVIKAQYRGLDQIRLAAATAFETVPRLVVPGRMIDALMASSRWLLAPIAVVTLWLAARTGVCREQRALACYAAGLTAAYLTLVDARETGALVRYLFPVWAVLAMWIGGRAAAWPALVVIGLHVWDVAGYVRWEAGAPLPASYVGVSHMLAPAAIDRVIPPGQRVGSFDAGAVGYFAPRVVINLDGLVNHDIVELRRNCRAPYPRCLMTYMRYRNIHALAGGTGFGWVGHFPDWPQWERLYESPPLADGSRLVILRVPAAGPGVTP